MNFNINSKWWPKRPGEAAFRVSEVRRHAPRLVEVVAHGGRPGASGGFQPGDKIKVDVGGPMRSYTPAELTDEHLRFTGVVHGGGPGSQWLDTLTVSDPIRFFGPARSLPTADLDVQWAAFVGDETTLGAAEALLTALPRHVHRHGALEVDADSVEAVQRMDIPVDVLGRSSRGTELRRWADRFTIPAGRGLVWLSGEATSLVPVKRTLLERGLERSMLRVKPYWSTKGKAHRKVLERGELRR